ncbi:integral membrane protein [Streptomyces sp. Mg1]|nr:integral membrane protein [Streptomyces sp. Mg1]
MARSYRSMAFRPLSRGRRRPEAVPVTQTDPSTTPSTAPAPAPPAGSGRVHRAWFVAAVGFVTIIGAAAFASLPGLLIEPLHEEFDWSRGTIAFAVSVNLALYGLTAPFAAALMDRYGIRRVVTLALMVISGGSVATVWMTASWQLVLFWGVLVGLGSGSMALSFAATITNRWFTARRGLVTGILTAAGASGQLIFLPLLSWLVEHHGWRPAAVTVSLAALAVVPFVWLLLRDHPADVGLAPYGGTYAQKPAPVAGAARRTLTVLFKGGPAPAPFWLLAGTFRDSAGASTKRAGQRTPLSCPAAHEPRHAGDRGGRAAGRDRRLRRHRHRGVRLVSRTASRPGGCWPSTTRCAGSRCCSCRCCSPRRCTRRWCSSSCSTGWTGSPPSRRRSRCAASSTGRTARSCSAGCWPRTRSARRWWRSWAAWRGTRSARTTSSGTRRARCARWRR